MSKSLKLTHGDVRQWEEAATTAAIQRDIRALRMRRAAQRRQPTIAEMCAGPATSSRGLMARIFGR